MIISLGSSLYFWGLVLPIVCLGLGLVAGSMCWVCRMGKDVLCVYPCEKCCKGGRGRKKKDRLELLSGSLRAESETKSWENGGRETEDLVVVGFGMEFLETPEFVEGDFKGFYEKGDSGVL